MSENDNTPIPLAFIRARIDRHFAWLVSDYPRVDEAVYMLQLDLEAEAERIAKKATTP